MGGLNLFDFSIGIGIDFVFAWGIENDLVLVWASKLSGFLCGGQN